MDTSGLKVKKTENIQQFHMLPEHPASAKININQAVYKFNLCGVLFCLPSTMFNKVKQVSFTHSGDLMNLYPSVCLLVS